MLADGLTNFLAPGSVFPITAAGDYPLPGIIDLLGSGVGTPPANIIGNAAYFGMDVGIGRVKPLTQVTVGATFVDGTSLNVKFQAAPDEADHTPDPGDWVTLVETGPILTAQLTLGQIIARFDYPPAFPAGLRPRFLRMMATGIGIFTAGSLSSAITTMGRDDQSNKFQPNNYVVR